MRINNCVNTGPVEGGKSSFATTKKKKKWGGGGKCFSMSKREVEEGG